MDQLPPMCSLTRDLTRNLGRSPDQVSNWRPVVLQPAEPHRPGLGPVGVAGTVDMLRSLETDPVGTTAALLSERFLSEADGQGEGAATAGGAALHNTPT